MSTSHLNHPPATKKAEHHGGSPRVRLHRLKQVRREQGVSTRRIAQHLRIDGLEVARQEDESTDLTLSQLYAWQKVLEVPVCDLLLDTDSPLSPPVMERARMVRIMKTAAALYERADTSTLRRLAERLIAQLKEIMPELEGVAPWTGENSRRSINRHRIGHRVLSPDGWREA
ncbi:MAG TPA: hypothetical protein VHZ24_14665 [Pirellulales bacterium]|jgi:transcriptional regulator with XRE-family HTH domain|nr:hypothetical protein [Pirellulales bacterium]